MSQFDWKGFTNRKILDFRYYYYYTTDYRLQIINNDSDTRLVSILSRGMARVLAAALAAAGSYDDSDDKGAGNRAPRKEHMRYVRKCAFADFIFGPCKHCGSDGIDHTTTDGFYGWFTVGWCVCRGWCVRVSHVFVVGSPKVRDVMRHTLPFSGDWWFVFMVGLPLAGVSVVAGVFVSLTSSELVARRCVMLCDTPRLLVVVGGFYGWFTVGWCVCRGWCVRVSHVFGVGSPKVRDVMRHTSPFSGGWWFVFMVGLRLVGVFVVAGVFVSLTSLELVARRCVMLCDIMRHTSPFSGGWWFLLLVYGWSVCLSWLVCSCLSRLWSW